MGKIEITKKVLGICATNCYTVVDTETKEALIIDPADRADVLIRDWKDKGVTPQAYCPLASLVGRLSGAS